MFLELDFKDRAKIIDTHCHLDNEDFSQDLSEVLHRAFSQNIAKIIIPAADTKTLPLAVKISEQYQGVYFAVGIHPLECENADFTLLKEFITHPKCVAVGECGLDYYHHKDEKLKQRQKAVFKAQLELALQYQKPVIIHTREANQDTFDILKEFITQNKANFRQDKGYGVLHCFNASELLLNLKEHFYFGIGGVLTFKNAKHLAQILDKIPKNRLLLETDAPYLAPQPYRGKRNEALLTNLVAEKMAECLNLPTDEVIRLCTKNTENLFF